MGGITRKDISDYLMNVLKRDEAVVIALKGKWGVGKTFFVREFLDKHFSNRYVYVSLFGKSSIDEVIKEIVLQLYRGARLANKFKKLLGLAEDSISYEAQYKSISLNLTTAAISSLLTLAERRDFKGIIVVLDDIERTTIDVDKVLGLVNSLKEEKDCKTILIYSEDELVNPSESEKENSNQKKYRKYKEKSIDIEIKFSPSLDESLEILKEMLSSNGRNEDLEIFLNLIKSFLKSISEEQNLRIVHYIYMKLKELNFINSLNISEYLKARIFRTVAFLFYIKKESSLAISTKKELKNYLSALHLARLMRISRESSGIREQNSEKTGKINEIPSEKLEKFKMILPQDDFLDTNEQFVEELLKFWEYEILSQDLRVAIEESLKSYWVKVKSIEDLGNKRRFILNAYKDYLTHLSYTKEDFVRKVWTFLQDNRKELLRIAGIRQYLFLLRKLIEYDKVSQTKYQDFALELFKNFLEEEVERDSEFLFSSDIYELNDIIEVLTSLGINKADVEKVISGIKSKKANTLFNELYAGDCTNLIRNVKQIINKMGWNPSELETVNSLSKDLLKNCFIKANDLSLIVDFFTNRVHSKPFSEFGKTLLQILDELEKDKCFKEKIRELKSALEAYIEKFKKQLGSS